ncbi:hypothetical protein ABW20_dc0106355 [Dactylellina cionopaga]|nr:hypothetical protein ABW20_dc0106355 [Dactylellina cionopaga]
MITTAASHSHVKQSTNAHRDSIVSTPELVRDSGPWSGSSASASLAGSFGFISNKPVERSSPAKKPSYQEAPEVTAETAEQRTFSDATRRSYLSAQEEHVYEPVDVVNDPSPGKGTLETDMGWSNTRHPNKTLSDDHGIDMSCPPVPKVEAYHSIASPLPNSTSSPITIKGQSKGAQALDRQYSISPVQISSPVAPSSPISPIQQVEPILTPKPVMQQVVESETPSEAASPAGVARSSMNFASLPARETLTHKKSMGGANTAGSRNSFLDDRASLFGRLTGGKSLGASSTVGDIGPQEAINVLSAGPVQNLPTQALEEEDDDDDLNEQLRLAEINKASVMQLSEKTSTQRLNEKISQLSQQGTGRLSKSMSTSSLSASSQVDERNSSKTAVLDTKSSSIELASNTRESILSDEGDWIPSRPYISTTQTTSPIRPAPKSSSTTTVSSPKKTVMTPATTKLPVPISTTKRILDSAVAYPALPTPLPSTEIDTPSKSKVPDDVDVTIAKKNQANIFSFAKQLLWRSGRSESPKPASQPVKAPLHKPKDGGVSSGFAITKGGESEGLAESSDRNLYPEIRPPVLQEPVHSGMDKIFDGLCESQETSQFKNPSIQKEGGLVTYGGTLKREVQLKGPSPAVIEGIQLIPENADDLLRSPVVSDNEPSLPGSPFSDVETSDDENGDDEILNANSRKISRNLSPQSIKRTPSTLSHLKEPRSFSSFQSKANELKKANRGLFSVKDSGISKPKTAPSNIRIVPATQREMDQRKTGHPNPPSSATLVSALAETFGPKEPNPRPASAMSTASTQGARPPPKSIAALNSAAKAQKKEQEERERKAAQRQEQERRRQENSRREEARREEERRQQAVKTTKKQLAKVSEDDDAKKRLAVANKSVQPLLHPSKVPPKTTSFSHKGHFSHPKYQQELKRQPKRLFPPEEESKPLREGLPQQESKRRRTEEFGETSAQSASAPPIRQSTAKKENLPPSKIGGIFSQDYTPAPQAHMQYNQGHSLVKSMLPPSQHSKPNGILPQVDAVKYSHDKLKFGTMVTPSAPRIGRQPSTVPRESPIYPNPESIELPEIHTDSEDGEDDKSFRVPKWADSPELRQALQDQLGIDPETIFGPIAPLSMENIFKGRSDRAKFRARTSSANWSGADRLTAVEIEADRIERQRILENGGWTYLKPQ